MKDIGLNNIRRTMSLFEKRLWIYILTLVVHSGYFSGQRVLLGYINKNAVNAITTHSRDLLVTTFILAAILCFGSFILNPVAFYIKFIVTRIMLMNTRKKAIEHMERLRISYFDNRHSGDIMARLSSDINVVDTFFANLREFLILIFTGVGSIVFMFVLNVPIACMMVFIGILSCIANYAFAGPIRKASESVQENISQSTQGLVDIISGNREMKNLNIGKKILGLFKASNDKTAEVMMKRDKINSWREGANYVISSLNLIGVISVGSVMVVNKWADIGTVVAIITLQNGATNLYLRFGGFLTQLQTALAGSSRLFELMDTESEEVAERTAFNIENCDIRMENVTFSYRENRNVLDKLNLKVMDGQTAALVGSSGGGKSTVLKLLQGFYTHQEGKILLGNVDTRQLSYKQIREIFSYVSQDSYLFDGTIEENIRFGQSEASDSEVEKASRMANAHEFISEMPDGYGTVVGERGIKLSGGQRQRIAIARAILNNAPVLLLDEATSSLDSESEKLVQDALNRLIESRTSIVVAHRLSTIENADIIYVIDEGRVVEQGRHEQLLQAKGRYYELFQVQFAQQAG